MYPCPLSKLLIITTIITLFIVSQSTIVGAHDLLDIPLNDPLYQDAYDFIDRIVAQRFVKGVVKNTRPYSRGEVVEILTQLNNQVKQNQVKLSSIEQRRLERLLSLLAIEKDEVSIPDSTGRDVVNSGQAEQSDIPQSGDAFLEAKGNQYHFTLDVEAGEEVVSQKVSESDSETGYITMLRPTVSGRVYCNFAFYSDLKFYYLSGAQFEEIPKTEARSVQGGLGATTAATTTAYALFKTPWFGLLLGKDKLYWGPGRHGALLVSDNPLPMNMVKLIAQYPSGPFQLQKGPHIKFHAFTGALGSGISRKYMSGHRVEMNVRDRINLGIAETILFANRFETIYLNPLQIYTVTELPVKVIRGEGKESPDNVLISGDFELLLKNLSVYGELMIDDFQPNYGWRSYRHWGSKFGLLFGLYYINPFSFPDSEFRLEYAFINQYAYTHDNNTNYTSFDSVIGHWIGSDADDLWVNFKHWFTGDFHTSVSFELKRHGEGNVNKPHPQDAPFEEEWEFLSGITESISSVSLSLSYTSVGRYLAELAYTLSRVKNVDNQLNRNATEHQLVLQGNYRF
jgi:hypothetical protein